MLAKCLFIENAGLEEFCIPKGCSEMGKGTNWGFYLQEVKPGCLITLPKGFTLVGWLS